jgi:hypothetical protein
MASGTEAELAVKPERVAPTARTHVAAPVITFADFAGTACEALDDCIAMGTDRPESIPDHLDAAIVLMAACEDLLEVLGEIPAIREALAEAPAPTPAPAPAVATKPPREGTLIMRAWEMVQQQQPCTNAQVAKALDEKRKRVHQALQALIKQEKVSKDGLHYSVVDASKSKASG